LVIDLGGGTTDYVVYVDGIIKHTGVLAVGGDHVSNDLAFGLKVPLGRAESLKVEHGSALLQDDARSQMITFGRDASGAERTASKEQLQLIMSARVEEIIQLVAQDIENAGLLGYLGSGVVLCGGGARIPQIAELAAGIFGTPVALGKTNCVNSIKSAIDHPEFATAIGLVRFGSFQQPRKKKAPGITGAVKETFTNLFRRS
jgi:cell division protein FtsA